LNFEFKKMKKQKYFGIAFLFSFDIGRSMLDVHLYKIIIVKILTSVF